MCDKNTRDEEFIIEFNKKYTIEEIKELFELDKTIDTKRIICTRDYGNIHVDRLFQKYKQAFIDLGLLIEL